MERTGTNGRVVVAGAVVAERIGTNGRIKTAGGVAQERCSANPVRCLPVVFTNPTRKPIAKL